MLKDDLNEYPPRGWVFFTADKEPLSKGIMHFTRWGAGEDRVTHAGLTCFEATLESHFPQGVHWNTWDRIVERAQSSEDQRVWIGKPIGWTPEYGQKIIEHGSKMVGQRYDVSSILALASNNTVFGRILGSITRGYSQKAVGALLNGKNRWFCSEHVAHSISAVIPEFEKVIKSQPIHFITPQMLMDWDELWEIPPFEIPFK
jgi:hypothetical protein